MLKTGMQQLVTVEEVRRQRWRAIALGLLLGLTCVAPGFVWWVVRPGEPVQSAMGIELPTGTRRMLEERSATARDEPFEAVYLASARPVAEVVPHLAAMAEESNLKARRFLLPGGVRAIVLRPLDVPPTRLAPIHQIWDGAPLGVRSWIVLSRGKEPRSTSEVAVPPFGES